MAEDNKTTQESVPESERYIGRIKWFNNSRGYGFLSYRGSDGSDKDVFVHFSAINCQNDNSFRTLTQGEYVSFSLADSNKPGQLQASNITGVNGGPLLSEQREQNRQSRGDRGGDRGGNRGGRGGGRGGYRGGGYRGGRSRREDYSQGQDQNGAEQSTEQPSESQVDQPEE